MITLDILKYTEEKDWNIGYVRYEYTGHDHYGSAFESSDDCGTCSGARCSTCVKRITDDILEFSCETDKLKQYLLKAGAPEDVASEFAYSDTVGSKYKGYYFKWPNCKDLKEYNPDLYKKLTTMDSEILAEIYAAIPDYKVFGEMKDVILKKHGIGEYEYGSFIEKQLDLFWRMNGETHDIFKMPDERFDVFDFGFNEFVFTNPNASEEIRERRKVELGSARFGGCKAGDYICYCNVPGVWKAGKILVNAYEYFQLEDGTKISKSSLLTDVYKIEEFNVDRYHMYKDARLQYSEFKESNIFRG